jgi:N utilization substance protein A
VLVDYGLPDKLLETLLESGVGTIEKLGGMTPEQLEEIPGIGSDMVEKIQEAVNAYYSQFEEQGQGEPGPAAAEEAVEAQVVAAGELPSAIEAEPSPAPAPEETPSEQAETEETPEQFATIEDAGSPTHNQSEGTGPEGAAPGEDAGPDGGDPGRDK